MGEICYFFHPWDCPALNTINGVLFIFSRWNLIFLFLPIHKHHFFSVLFSRFIKFKHLNWVSYRLSLRFCDFFLLLSAGFCSDLGLEGEIKRHSAWHLIDCKREKVSSMLQNILRWTFLNRLFIYTAESGRSPWGLAEVIQSSPSKLVSFIFLNSILNKFCVKGLVTTSKLISFPYQEKRRISFTRGWKKEFKYF